jgi:phosphoribosylanthranilate isomerase
VNLRIKICGITTPDDALFCAEAGADALGFIFYAPSPRAIVANAAAAIIRDLPPFVTPVGVFVNESRETIESIVARTGIRALQMSGDERPEACLGYSLPVVKAFRMRDANEAGAAREYDVSAALLDGSKDGLYGGTGKMPDLAVALRLKEYHLLILAGGLDPENIADAVRAVRPYAVDVNSGVEASPGVKDRRKVKQLFERIAQLD